MNCPLRKRALPLAWAGLVLVFCAVAFAQKPRQPQQANTVPQTQAEQQPPMFHQLVPGLLVRTLYTAHDRVEVQLWDLMVGPGHDCDTVTLPGAAVLEVRSGSGALEDGGKRTDLRLGTMVSLAPGSNFQLHNASRQQSLVVRAVIVLTKKN